MVSTRANTAATHSSVNIVLEVLNNEHSLMCPTDHDGNQQLNDDRGSSNRDGNQPLNDDHWTLVQNPRRAWKKGDGVIKD
jgi:hypothetical protein